MRPTTPSTVTCRPEESCGALEDLVGAAQLPVLALELDDAPTLLGREARSGSLVDLGLADPLAKRLGSDAEVAGYAGNGSIAFAGLLDRLEDHPDGALSKLRRVAVTVVVTALVL